MDAMTEIPLFRDSVNGLFDNIAYMLGSEFGATHKIYKANQDIPVTTQPYIVVKRNVRQGNLNGLNLTPITTYLDALTEEKHYIYMATTSFRIKFHKDSAIDDAYYLKMLLSTDEFHYTWWGGNHLYGITNISDVSDDPVSVDFVEWEEGAIFTFDCNYLFRHTEGNVKTVENILFTTSNGGTELPSNIGNFWIDLGYDSYKDYVTSLGL